MRLDSHHRPPPQCLVNAHPTPYRDPNDWLTWNLRQYGATEAPLGAFILMDVGNNPVYAVLGVNYHVWKLPSGEKCTLRHY